MKVIAFPICKWELLPFPIYYYNIFLDYDVSLHILVVRDDVGKPQEQGVMSTAVSFPSVRNQGLSTSRRNKSLQKVLPGAATRNLHTTQPKYFAPTYSEVVNLTGLLKTND